MTFTSVLVAVNLSLFLVAFMVLLESLSTRSTLKKAILKLSEVEAEARKLRVTNSDLRVQITRAEFQLRVYREGAR